MTHPTTYTSLELAKKVGVSYRQLDYWIRTGLVTSSIRDAAGSGSSRVFGQDDYTDLVVVKKLLDLGFDITAIRPVMLTIKGHPRKTEDQAAVVFDGQDTRVFGTWTEARKYAENLPACTIVKPRELAPNEQPSEQKEAS